MSQSGCNTRVSVHSTVRVALQPRHPLVIFWSQAAWAVPLILFLQPFPGVSLLNTSAVNWRNFPPAVLFLISVCFTKPQDSGCAKPDAGFSNTVTCPRE